ncbi:hypothetical protein CIPAW_05G078000 [Carya illinoinensis]|uniref:Amidase domain-containing protein n=1 Tax=Carya illinoinensis TaxID=32201 RepID=A0A8T1QGZ2_CARIL|nr:hypothetical protein CIPAW_05G078000 [Carya illinoinensis]
MVRGVFGLGLEWLEEWIEGESAKLSRGSSMEVALRLVIPLLLLILLVILSSGSPIQNQLTSKRLVEFYLGKIQRFNPVLKGIIEVNPDAMYQANKADSERKACSLSGLHGIPVLLKDNIGTKDKLNTTAGSLVLLGSVVPRDAGVVAKLRKAGAVVLGKASLSEWANFRSLNAPNGWSARDPCGSSSGSAISVAVNLVAVALGTETDGSILCLASNSVVGIKPTVGLTSRAKVIPILPRQDTIGPIGRTVSDAVYVLDAIAGFDYYDESTTDASKYIPRGGYNQFLKACGLKGKRLGMVRNPFFISGSGSGQVKAFEHHFQTLRQGCAVLIDHLEIANIDVILNATLTGEARTLLAEFKLSLNAYLKDLVVSPVRTLADVIFFNEKFSNLVRISAKGLFISLVFACSGRGSGAHSFYDYSTGIYGIIAGNDQGIWPRHLSGSPNHKWNWQ